MPATTPHILVIGAVPVLESLRADAGTIRHAVTLLDGYRLMFNTGPNGGQEVFHVHAHVLGGAPLGPMLAR